MPTSIPYYPSLVLGQVVNTETIDLLNAVANAEKSVDMAESRLNNLIQAKLSLEATEFEISSIGVSMNDDQDLLKVSNERLDSDIRAAVLSLVGKRIRAYADDSINPNTLESTSSATGTTEGTVSKAWKSVTDHFDRKEIQDLTAEVETPVDFTRSLIESLPLASNNMNLNSQYFSFDSNSQEGTSTTKNIKGFVSASVATLGVQYRAQVAGAVSEQVAYTIDAHSIQGVLVITATTTLENVRQFTPLVIDGDKAVRAWNHYHRENEDDIIDEDSLIDMVRIVQEPTVVGEDGVESINILSGMAMGASFVGMVFVHRTEKTESSQRMQAVSTNIQAQMKKGGWFARMQGGFGVDESFASDVKKLLSTQEIQSHCAMVCVGAIPSIKSHEVEIGVKQFADFDPKEMMDKLASLHNSTTNETNSLDKAAESARTGQAMISMQGATIESTVSALGKLDSGKNQMLDINTLMTAFEDFVNIVQSGNAGVPINFYISKLTKKRIARVWIDENYPDGLPDIGTVDPGTTAPGPST